MLYYFTNEISLPSLPQISSLTIREEDDLDLLSSIGKISIEETRRRLANDNKAWVAYYQNTPAAFGWMAMGKVRIGELNHEFILPIGHRYLWNFRTLEEFRGLGIYPLLLQQIIRDERFNADCFWILHAPENKASERGITKAGFIFSGHVSVYDTGLVTINTTNNENDLINNLVMRESPVEPASCWLCSSPYLAHKRTSCCCDAVDKNCNRENFKKNALLLSEITNGSENHRPGVLPA